MRKVPSEVIVVFEKEVIWDVLQCDVRGRKLQVKTHKVWKIQHNKTDGVLLTAWLEVLE